MATARATLVDPEVPLAYHLVSRCVRRAWLCGWDRVTRKDYTYRKVRLEQRLFRLVQAFAVELYAYAIMTNHFHLVVHYDPKACLRWSDEEVARRWIAAFAPPAVLDNAFERARTVAALLQRPERLEQMRQRLGSLSAFMQHLKQPIARQANREDALTGHFFEQRFYSGALLDEAALIAAMAYVDLNPVRARIAKDIQGCRHTAIAHRLENNTAHRLDAFLRPVASGLQDKDHRSQRARVPLTLRQYLERLRQLIAHEHNEHHDGPSDTMLPRDQRWAQHVATLSRRQRAFGAKEAITQWLT